MRQAVWTVLTVAVVLGVGPRAEARQKTDVITLDNGDRLTAEIKQLERGRLTVKTDPLGTVTIYWGDVAGIVSTKRFEVEVVPGIRYYGTLVAGDPDTIVVAGVGGVLASVPLLDVIRISPLGASFWSRLDGNVDLGFSFTQASRETQWTLNSSVSYRRERYLTKATLNSQLSAIRDAETQTRNVLTLSTRRFIGRRWVALGFGQAQQDQSLDLDLRSLLGGAYGRILVERAEVNLSLYSGLAYTNEQFAGESGDNSLEAILGSDLEWFSPGDNDWDLSTQVISYYNLSGRARARVELNTSFTLKVVKDLRWSTNVFNSYDSSPPGDQKNNDFGVSLTLGWTF